jgi:hypothetical protein
MQLTKSKRSADKEKPRIAAAKRSSANVKAFLPFKNLILLLLHRAIFRDKKPARRDIEDLAAGKIAVRGAGVTVVT